MTIHFGESLRRLRKEKNLTQEQLAARLNVSFQTISNWERDESWPDLSMLPVLADFFGVRTDDLLGMDRAENERKIVELLDYFNTNASLRIGQWEEHKAQLAALLKDNPGDYRLWTLHFGLLTSLCPEDTAESMRARLPGILSVYEMILEHCTNDALRMEVKDNLSHVYGRITGLDPKGSAAEAAALEKIVSELPGLLQSREYVSTHHLKPRATVCRNSIIETLRALDGMICNLISGVAEDGSDWHMIGLPFFYATLALLRAAFPDGDYGKCINSVLGNWQHIAYGHARAGNYDKAFEALQTLIALSLQYDALPQTSTHTSPMFAGHIYEKEDHGESCAAQTRKFLDEAHAWSAYYPWPEAFKADPRFAALRKTL